MRDYVRRQEDEAEYDIWYRRQVQLGLDSADAGRLVPADEVEAEFARRRTEAGRKPDDATS
jgi:predicted transcriptional regulator